MTLTVTLKLDGLKKLKKSVTSKKVVVGVIDDPEVASYAAYQEFGWVQRVTPKQARWIGANSGVHVKPGGQLHLPPRPFLRSTMKSKVKEWTKLGGSVLAKTKNTDTALAMVGTRAVEDVKDTIQRNGTGETRFAERSGLTMALIEQEAQGHGKRKGRGAKSNSTTRKALVRTGRLLESISFEVRDK